jgi:hypothetical protein
VTLQNRVQPDGQVLAIPARGTMTGNRGIIHGPDRVLTTKRWSHKAWICCELDWQGRKRQVMTGSNWTELFFLDEAVAMSAGHRPCGYCRRTAYVKFVDAWETAVGIRPKAPDMDAVLHPARVNRDRSQVTHQAQIATIPDGAIILHNQTPHLVCAHSLRPYSSNGYGAQVPRPQFGEVTILTPKPMVAVLNNGYHPALHSSAL